MCKLSETSERWTSLSTSHGERIMTAIARSKAMARCSAKFVNTDCPPCLVRTFSAHECATMREQTLFQDQAVVVHASMLICLDRKQFGDVLSQFSGSFRDSAHESCIKGAIRVRGGVLKSTLVVGNDTTVHDVHTYTVAFSPSVLQSRSSVASVPPITDAHAPHERLKKTIHGI